MKGINKVILVGTLGQDPTVRYAQNGDAVTNISAATSEQWKDKQGKKQEKTEWHNIVIFGKLAEVAGEYLRKGSQVYIEGKLQTRKWQDKQGQDRYTTEVVVDGFSGVMQMLGGPRGGEGGSYQSGGQSQPYNQQQGYQQQSQSAPMEQSYDNADYDLNMPF